jgi:hypothetical protein
MTIVGCVALTLAFPGCREAYSREGSRVEKARLRSERDASLIVRGRSLLRDGDLVVRTGNDFVSLTLRQFSHKNKTYSHCGLVRIEDGRAMVYHAIGGEDKPDARLRRDTFQAFCDPGHNLGFGIFRYRLSDAVRARLDSVVDLDYRLKLRFDMKFDLRTDSSLYCAEFVAKALEKATRDKHYIPLSHIGDFIYVAVDDLFENPHCRPVYQAVFR